MAKPGNSKGGSATNIATGNPAGGSRPVAAVATINWDDAAVEAELKSVAGPRASKWADLLDSLYEGTAAGEAPRGEDGTLKFVRLGTFNNIGGARTQVKAFEDKGFNKTYDFKTTVKGDPDNKGKGQSFLWARVKETKPAAE